MPGGSADLYKWLFLAGLFCCSSCQSVSSTFENKTGESSISLFLAFLSFSFFFTSFFRTKNTNVLRISDRYVKERISRSISSEFRLRYKQIYSKYVTISPRNHDNRRLALRTNFADISIDVLQKIRKAREDRRGCTRNHEPIAPIRDVRERERERKRGRVSQASNVTSTCSIIVIFRRLLLRPSAVAFRRHRANVSITHRYVEFSEKTYCRRREILRTRLRVPKRVCRVSRSLSSVLKEHSRVSIHMQHRKTLVYSPVRRHSIPLCSTITLSGIILFLSMNRERERNRLKPIDTESSNRFELATHVAIQTDVYI